jgi:hypothetical protein
MQTVDPLESLDRDDAVAQARGIVEAEKQCRVTLARTWPRTVFLEWNVGGPRSKATIIPLQPGCSIVQPMHKVAAWFGPFYVPDQFRFAIDEKAKEKLREFWRVEKTRYLNRYDYPRGDGRGGRPNMTPSGPHRSPDVTVQVLHDDGTADEPIRLYKIYGIGEFDPLKDSFGQIETPEQLKEKYEDEMARLSKHYEQQAQDFRMQLAELKGLISSKLSMEIPRETREPVEAMTTPMPIVDSMGRKRDPATGRILPKDADG